MTFMPLYALDVPEKQLSSGKFFISIKSAYLDVIGQESTRCRYNSQKHFLTLFFSSLLPGIPDSVPSKLLR